MSYETHLLEDKKDKSWLSFIFKVIFVLCALFLIMITVLANMGGNGDAWKDSLETFVSSAAGNKPAKVGVLNQMRFFPRMGFDAEHIEIFQDDKNLFPLVTIRKAQMYIKFWNVAFGDSRFSHIYLEDFRALKGVIGREEIWLERLFVDHDIEAKKAFLRANGKVGVHPWSMRAELKISGSKGDYMFSFPDKSHARFELSDMVIDLNIRRHEDAYLKVDNFKITHEEQEVSGNLVLSSTGRNLLKIKGTLQDGQKTNEVQFDLLIDNARRPVKFMGDVTSPELSMLALDKTYDFVSIYNEFRDIFGYDNADFVSEDEGILLGGYDLDLNFKIQNVDARSDTKEDLLFSIIQENRKYHISAIKTQKGEELLAPLASVFDSDGNAVSFTLKGNVDQDFVKKLGLDQSHFTVGECRVSVSGKDQDKVVLLKDSYDFMSSVFQGDYAQSNCKDYMELSEPEENEGGYLEDPKAMESAQ